MWTLGPDPTRDGPGSAHHAWWVAPATAAGRTSTLFVNVEQSIASAVPTKKRHETNADLSIKAASAAVRRHICVDPEAVNRVFCTYVAIFRSTRWTPFSAPAVDPR